LEKTVRQKTTHAIWVVAVTTLLLGCCGPDDTDHSIPKVQVTASATDSITSPSHLITLTVRAENHGSSPVPLGRGSSSCWLAATVSEDSQEYRVVEHRPCTDDFVEHWLNPGESHVEVWEWDGSVLRNNAVQVLPPGKYIVRGMAGQWRSDNRLDITVVE
jgi:hypothetical protein